MGSGDRSGRSALVRAALLGTARRMTAGDTRPPEEFPPVRVRVDQQQQYRFQVSYPGSGLPSLTVDEAAPIGTGAGPDPAQALAGALGHCLSSTLFNSLERARVRTTPIRTAVTVRYHRNDRGRKRIESVEVEVGCAPVDEADRPRFDRCVAVFEEYCTVTGSVREGIRVRADVRPPTADASARSPP